VLDSFLSVATVAIESLTTSIPGAASGAPTIPGAIPPMTFGYNRKSTDKPR
jgi:hypothetical protein